MRTTTLRRWSRPSTAGQLNLNLHPKQWVAFESAATEILYGGAAGGGKSHLMRVADSRRRHAMGRCCRGRLLRLLEQRQARYRAVRYSTRLDALSQHGLGERFSRQYWLVGRRPRRLYSGTFRVGGGGTPVG